MISVIIPAYNCGSYINKAVSSIVASAAVERNSEYEIIIVNDGSTDNTLEICNKLQKKYSENLIRIITQENGGCVNARLTGFKHARGTYCTTVDADDYVSDSYIDELTKILDKHKEYDYILLNNFLNVPGTDKFHLERSGEREKEVIDKEQLIEWILVKGEGAIWNKIFDTSIMCKIALDIPRENGITYGDDLLLNLMYLSRNEVRKTYISDNACYYHYVDSAVSVCGNLKTEKALTDHIVLYFEIERILNMELHIKNQKLLSYIMLNRIRSISKYARKVQGYEGALNDCIRENIKTIQNNIKKYRPASIKQLAYKIDFWLLSLSV